MPGKAKAGDRRLKKNNPNAGKAGRDALAQKRAQEELNHVPTTHVPPVITATGIGNPFDIVEDMEFHGNRSENMVAIELLISQLLKLEPGNKKQSVVIPLTVCKEKKDAVNLFNQAKKAITNNEHCPECNFVSRSIYTLEEPKKYVCTRVWRIK